MPLQHVRRVTRARTSEQSGFRAPQKLRPRRLIDTRCTSKRRHFSGDVVQLISAGDNAEASELWSSHKLRFGSAMPKEPDRPKTLSDKRGVTTSFGRRLTVLAQSASASRAMMISSGSSRTRHSGSQ
jgi:hypothetical protein